ncbi:uncharacterized protein LOC113359658 [Papaver somniferum]|uniref:uncharacterized protein LOC113359658 n=1 Tax=Papaver somniferum TaxID=3469 RepID=UPI000E705649|nr:uncharacterized protein LOC113359658 [Papaver somniferum]
MSGSRWDVSLTEKSCSCCVWDITGIPCIHAVAVGIHLRVDLNSMVDDLHKVSSYKKAYAGKVKACAIEENWLEHEMRPNKPKYKRKVGRPQLNRIRSDVEGRPNPEKSKRNCSGCGSSARNVRRCPTKNVPSTNTRGRGRGRGRGQGRGNTTLAQQNGA